MTNSPVWLDEPWQGLPGLSSPAQADLCVVGLGGSGLSAVDEALHAGKTVIGIDAGAAAGEAAGRNGGFLLAGMALFYHEAEERWGSETARMVYQRSLEELDVLLSQTASRRVGSLRIADSGRELEDIETELKALRTAGFAAEPYEGVEGQGLLVPGNGVCNPMKRCRVLVPRLIEGGARLYEQTMAMSIERGLVTTPGGTIEADHIVVAVDGRVEVLFPELEGRVRTARLEMLATDPFPQKYTRPVYTAYGYVYWQQLPDGRLALGGLRNRFADHSWSLDPGPTQELQTALDGYLSELGINAPVSHRWAGHAAYTPDRAPIYEEIRPGVWVVGGYCGHGNVLGSVYARAAVRSALAGVKEALL